MTAKVLNDMNLVFAAAYVWSDLDLGHSFHATQQGERYTLSETARRTVLDLNHQRYEEEVKAGLHEKKKGQGTKAKPKRAKKSAPTDPAQVDLIKPPQQELFS